MSKTKENLMAAFAGESQANRKYLAFAKKAEREGFPQIAKLFRAAAAAETVHAHAHFRVAGGIQGTAENLEAAIAGERDHGPVGEGELGRAGPAWAEPDHQHAGRRFERHRHLSFRVDRATRASTMSSHGRRACWSFG